MVNQHAFDTTPDTTRLEIAQEALGCLIALRSQLISVERGKADPNAESISELKNQRNVLFGLLRSLSCDDQLNIENIIATYGPCAKALFTSCDVTADTGYVFHRAT